MKPNVSWGQYYDLVYVMWRNFDQSHAHITRWGIVNFVTSLLCLLKTSQTAWKGLIVCPVLIYNVLICICSYLYLFLYFSCGVCFGLRRDWKDWGFESPLIFDWYPSKLRMMLMFISSEENIFYLCLLVTWLFCAQNYARSWAEFSWNFLKR